MGDLKSLLTPAIRPRHRHCVTARSRMHVAVSSGPRLYPGVRTPEPAVQRVSPMQQPRRCLYSPGRDPGSPKDHIVLSGVLMLPGSGMLEAIRVLCVPVSVAAAGTSGLSGHAFRNVRARLSGRAVLQRVPGASRGVRSEGSSAGRDKDRVECAPGAGGVKPVGLEHVLEASAVAHDGRRRIATFVRGRRGCAADGAHGPCSGPRRR